MNSDICLCTATRADHADLGARLADALKNKGKDAIGGDALVAFNVSACDRFQIDRKATWHAERGHAPRRTCLLLTGCTVCGAPGAVTYHKDARGILRHTSCPGAKPAEVAR